MSNVSNDCERRWTPGKRWAAAFFVVFLAVQIGWPTWRLFGGGRMQRFGWQMYSGVNILPACFVEFPDGRMEPVVLADFLGHRRDDLHLDERLPAHLCRCHEGAQAVRIKYDDREEVFRCP